MAAKPRFDPPLFVGMLFSLLITVTAALETRRFDDGSQC